MEEVRANAEAASRWENSGMSVMDYIRSRVEECDPEFDLDWETAREMEHDREMGWFQDRAMIGGKETAVAEGYPLTLKEAKDPDKVVKIVGKSAAQLEKQDLLELMKSRSIIL